MRSAAPICVLLCLGSGAAPALDVSKLPAGADHAAAQAQSTGAGINVAIVSVSSSQAASGLDENTSHIGARQIQDRYFVGQTPPLAGLPAAATGTSNHGALVADVALGDDAVHTGVAVEADYYGAWKNNYDSTRAAMDLYQRSQNVYLYTNSWGAGKNSNGASQYALFFDWFASQKDAVILKSAGNAGGQISTPGDAFNIITVGGLDNANQAYIRRRSSSSYLLKGDAGGAPDERGKPEIVAPGHLISNGFFEKTGTSFAAPHVAGVVAMLVEAGLSLPGPAARNRLAHKAIILNSARKRGINLPSSGNAAAQDSAGTAAEASDYDYLLADRLRAGATGQAGTPHTSQWTPSAWEFDGELFSTTQPLDDELGAGVVDAERALIQHASGEQEEGSVDPIGWNRDALSAAGEEHVYAFGFDVAAGTFVTATLTWDRIVDEVNGAGGSVGQIDQTDSYQQHAGTFLPDYDLCLYEVVAAVATVFACSIGVANSLSGQNVEHLHVPTPRAGRYELHVERVDASGFSHDYGFAWWTEPALPVPGPATGILGFALLASALLLPAFLALTPARGLAALRSAEPPPRSRLAASYTPPQSTRSGCCACGGACKSAAGASRET